MSASTPARPSYAAVLRTPHAVRTFGAALLARLSYGMVSLALMLAVTRATGSYAVAGTVLALFGAMSVLLSPARAALVDRYGPRRALVPMALLYAAFLGTFAAIAWRPGAPPVLVGAVAVAAGACTPPLGAAMRAVWSELVDDRGLLQRAYSLDGVAEELLFVSGPLLVGVLLGFGPAAGAVAVSAALVAVGTVAFVLSPAVTGAPPTGAAKGLRRVPGLARPVVVAAGVGLALGALELLVMAFAQEERHGDDVVAWVLAALSLGSAAGGLLNGAVNWRTSAAVRLPLLAAGFGAALFAVGLAPNLGVLAAAVVCAGVFVAPALTTAYLIADETAPPGARTQAGAWVNSAVNAGSSAGTAGAGLVVGHLPPAVSFALTGTVALLAAVTSAWQPRRVADRAAARERTDPADRPAPERERRAVP